MAARKPLVIGSSGHPEQLQASDTLSGVTGGGLAVTAVDCDFGAPGAAARSFDISDGAALAASSLVLAWLSGVQPTGVDRDELELDPLQLSGAVPADGTVRIFIDSINGSVITGKRRVLYALI